MLQANRDRQVPRLALLLIVLLSSHKYPKRSETTAVSPAAPLVRVAPPPALTVAAVATAAAVAAAATPLLTDGPTTYRRSFAWRTAGCVFLALSLMLGPFGWGDNSSVTPTSFP